LISWSSSTASSSPATSAKVIFGESLVTCFVLARPKLITLEPPPCIWLRKNRTKPNTRTNGRTLIARVTQRLSPWLSTSKGSTSAATIFLVSVDE